MQSEEAIAILTKVCASVNADFATHQKIQEALTTIKDLQIMSESVHVPASLESIKALSTLTTPEPPEDCD